MKSQGQVIPQLNKVLTCKLTSINQFFLHARMFKNWGLEDLNKAAYKKSIADMKQADDIIARVLFLEGLPNLQALNKLQIGEHTEEMLACDMAFELDNIPVIREAITLCEQAQDYVTRELLVKLLDTEEEHVDWLETQQHQIDTMGIENYLAAQLESA